MGHQEARDIVREGVVSRQQALEEPTPLIAPWPCGMVLVTPILHVKELRQRGLGLWGQVPSAGPSCFQVCRAQGTLDQPQPCRDGGTGLGGGTGQL